MATALKQLDLDPPRQSEPRSASMSEGAWWKFSWVNPQAGEPHQAAFEKRLLDIFEDQLSKMEPEAADRAIDEVRALQPHASRGR